MALDENTEIKLIGTLQHPGEKNYTTEDLVLASALGCFDARSSYEILEEETSKSEEKKEKKREVIFENTSGKGHGAVLDQSEFAFSLKNVPRLTTLQICQPQYTEHLQQSLRRAEARNFHIPENIKKTGLKNKFSDILKESFETYTTLTEKLSIPLEDARYVLPLYTNTNIHTKLNARELMHLHNMSKDGNVPSAIRNTVEALVEAAKKEAPLLMKDRGTNYEPLAWYPSAQLFAEDNKTIDMLIKKNKQDFEKEVKVALLNHAGITLDEKTLDEAIRSRDEAELSNLKHLHYTFLTGMSLSTFHQAIRQRTWDQSVENIYSAAERGNIIVPPSIRKSQKAKHIYEEANKKLIDFYNKLSQNGIRKQEAIGVLPHSLEIYDLIHINGWNAIHSIGKRTCTKAQWEIRKIANAMAKQIRQTDPIMGKYSYPQGVVYGKCPEAKSCNLCSNIIEKQKYQKKYQKES